MTKTLTEQWREGTLPDGFYYIKKNKFGIIKGIKTEELFCGEFCTTPNDFIEEVLAPVPSYDEYKELVSNSDELSRKTLQLEEELKNETVSNDLLCEQIKKQDSQLKDMACENDTLSMENGRLQKRLSIATKALERYSKDDYYSEGGGRSVNPYPHIARKALKEMEGVK